MEVREIETARYDMEILNRIQKEANRKLNDQGYLYVDEVLDEIYDALGGPRVEKETTFII